MNSTVRFTKMVASGNDFIILDLRENRIRGLLSEVAKVLCKRRIGVGADGIIFIDESKIAPVRWIFFNADGSRAKMCGNGARCLGMYGYLRGIFKESFSFESDSGVVFGRIIGERVAILMDFKVLKENLSIKVYGKTFKGDLVDTGVPHFVCEVEDLDSVDVLRFGEALRFHEMFSPEGANVDFVEPIKDGKIKIRTYERGVEGETLSCGTGAVASALVFAKKEKMGSPVFVITKDSPLNVHFLREGENFSQIYLEGDANVVYEGILSKHILRGLN